MLETIIAIILAPIAIVAAAFTVALGVGIVKGFINMCKEESK